MKLAISLCLLGCAVAARVNIHKRASPLEVKLERMGNSAVKASFTNTGSEAINILKTGSVLDSTAVEKAEIYSSSSSDQIPFDGIRLQIDRAHINTDLVQTLEPDETVSVEWDPAQVHDLSAGGIFDILVRGSFLTTDPTTNKLTGAVPYDSNLLAALQIDGPVAAQVRRAFHQRRTDLQDDCTGTRGEAQRTALTNCARLATQAAEAVNGGGGVDDKLVEYFQSSSAQTRETVAEVFAAIADECGSTTGGIAEQYCRTDLYDACAPGVLAYTVPSRNVMVSCDTYFERLEAVTSECHEQDQASTTLHETTHLRDIKGTNDYGYGYEAVLELSAAQNLNNADTYTLFANAIDLGC